MKKIALISILLLSFIVKNSYSQHKKLYMPEHISECYQNGTRDYSGKPGKNYFQNYSVYNIAASLDPPTRVITGNAKINYQNNSPDTLNHIIFNLYANIYKKGNIRDWSIGDADLHDGVNISALKINGKAIDMTSKNVTNRNTALIIELDDKIMPTKTADIEITWSYPLPAKGNIRLGTYYETSFFVGHWYPKIAVYDDLVGWNVDTYSGQTEFYHDYADYNVEITMPKEYIVLSSGTLTNEKDVLSKDILKKWTASKESDIVTNVITAEDRKKTGITKDADKLTWKFKATNLPDFAFATSNTYIWDATSLLIDDKRILINALYYPENQTFNQVAEISQKVIKMLSETAVGMDYPYPQMTAFHGHYGMEYPAMVNDGDGDYNSTVFVTAHEITHTYFPFYVATNEVKNAWLDEGFATFLPKIIEDALIENNNSLQGIVDIYQKYMGTEIDIPLIINSDNTSGFAYRYHAYGKSAMALLGLKQAIGDVKFYKSLQEFIMRWNGKHPTAYDFFYTVESIAKEDLRWYWKPWFFELGYPDLCINTVDIIDKNYAIIEVKKVGNYPVPIKITTVYKDGYQESIEIKASIWRNEREKYFFELDNIQDIKQIILGDDMIPDKNKEDNIYTFN